MSNIQSSQLSSQLSLLETNVKALSEGIELLSLLDDQQYQETFEPAFKSPIGAHFRHVLEHYNCFFEQLESAEFCYDNRQREQRLELDRDYALVVIKRLISEFSDFDLTLFEKNYQINDLQCSALVNTNLYRELLFLQSHTVHHYALVAAMTRGLGQQPASDFGVAIATRVFTAEQSANEAQDKQSSENSARLEPKLGDNCTTSVNNKPQDRTCAQ